VGTPAILYLSTATQVNSAIGFAVANLLNNIYQGKFSATTPAAGTGGGGGGGGGYGGCPHPDQYLELADGSWRKACLLEVGDRLMPPDRLTAPDGGETTILSLRRKSTPDWISVEFHNGDFMTVTPDHRF